MEYTTTYGSLSEGATVGGSEVIKTMQAGDVKPLDDLHSIESALYVVKELTSQIVDYKELKKKRAKTIDRQIEKLEKKIEFLKLIILVTLKEHKQKQVRFPGIGMVSERKPRTSYEIIDKEELFEYLKKEDEFNNIVEIQQEPSIKKHELNKLLSTWAKQGSLPDCIGVVKSGQTVTIKIENEELLFDDYEDITNEIQDLDFT